MIESIPLNYYLILSAILFTIGATGVLLKRNPIIIFMCVELMLNAVNLTLVAFSRYHPATASGAPDMGGQMMVIFVMAVAAAEVAVGLGIIVSIFRSRVSINIDEMDVMRG
jgi:NADH-quinone oxidoreductase subunit K